VILEKNGHRQNGGAGKGRRRAGEGGNRLKWFGSLLDDWFGGLFGGAAGAALPPELKARDPYSNHAWVFAGAQAIATAAMNAPFRVYAEDPREPGPQPRAGRKRAAIARLHARATLLRATSAQAIDDHPVAVLLSNPNPYQHGDDLWALTFLWLVVCGEVFWVLDWGEIGGGPRVGEIPERVWPLGPESLEPVHVGGGKRGELGGWRLRFPPYLPGAERRVETFLDLEEVVQFKLPNPADPTRGKSKISAAAEAVTTDLKLRTHEDRMLSNRAVPEGILEYEGVGVDPDTLRQRWENRHRGPENAGRVGVLIGGIKYHQVGLSPRDMEHLNTRRWDREEILAVLGVPPSLLGVTDVVNYATAMAQLKIFWENTVLPLLKRLETTLEFSPLFGFETDRLFGAFDLTNVEALRVGVSEKIDLARKLAEEPLRAPPRVAYDFAGVDVNRYPGDDVALVGQGLVPTDVALEPPESVEDEPPVEEEDDAPAPATVARRRARRRTWGEYLSLHSPVEARMRRAYRKWVAEAQEEVLRAFDKVTRALDPRVALPPLAALRARLKTYARPVYGAALVETFDFVSGEIGTQTVEVDDPRLTRFFEFRERRLLDTVPANLERRLRSAMDEGQRQGETVPQLRARLAREFSLASSSSKSLSVARTEATGFVNGARDELFRIQGFVKHEWGTAGDEAVRDTHRIYGDAGEVDLGFNFMELVGGGGVLEYPGDPRAPASEVIGCRCFATPT
jgi:phage portal protein BeeE